MYRKYFKSRHARLWKRAKEIAGVRVMLHCCGGVRELLPDLIDAGLDIINPVQISCRGMEAAGLKRDFGDAIVFWGGGCDTQTVLAGGTPESIRGPSLRAVTRGSCPASSAYSRQPSGGMLCAEGVVFQGVCE